MSRKDYVKIANVLRAARTGMSNRMRKFSAEEAECAASEFIATVDALCEMFASDNPRFDAKKFRGAVFND